MLTKLKNKLQLNFKIKKYNYGKQFLNKNTYQIQTKLIMLQEMYFLLYLFNIFICHFIHILV